MAQHYLEESLKLRQGFESWLYVGYSLADLGLLHHLRGENEAGRNYSQQAKEIAEERRDLLLQAMASRYLGHTLVALKELEEAQKVYQQARKLHQEAGEHAPALEATAGLAQTILSQGNLDQAQQYVEEIIPHLETKVLSGLAEPFRIHLTCYRVLRANQDPRAEEILTTAHRLLNERAAAIEDETLRRSFLEKISIHQDLVKARYPQNLDNETPPA